MSRSRRGLRILVVSPQLPRPASSGFATRVFELVRHLASRHSLTVLCHESHEASADEPLHEICEVMALPSRDVAPATRRLSQALSLASPTPFHARHVATRPMQRALHSLLRSTPFDIVQFESSQLSPLGLPSGVATVFDEHNIEYELLDRMAHGEASALRRTFNDIEHRKFAGIERRAWRDADACAVTSLREAHIVKDYAPMTPVAVVPNAVDLDYFAPRHGSPSADSMVFTGILTYRPNLDAALHLTRTLFPMIASRRPGATLTVVGHGRAADLDKLRGPGVTVTGKVPDVRPYLATASVVVTPLRMGGGTRLKVLEALAMAKPVVSTSLGSEGIAVTPGEHLLVADEDEVFSDLVAHLLRDPAKRDELGSAGRSLVRDKYSWEAASERLEGLHAMALRRSSGRVSGRRTGARTLVGLHGVSTSTQPAR